MRKIRFMIPIFVSLPIWFYLSYQVLLRVQATELMWFLFWVYLPATLLSSIMAVLSDESVKK